MAGSQSLVSTTNTLTFTTSATTATPGPVVATVSLSISALVATPAQESVAQPSCSSPEGSFYLTRQRSRVAAKKAWVEPPKKTQRVRPRKAVAKVVGIKEGGGGVKNLLLL